MKAHLGKLGLPGLCLVLLLVETACTDASWQNDPLVMDVSNTCRLQSGMDYECIEQQAVKFSNPEICRLAGIYIDDMCLQAVYEAANEPSICDRIYLRGVAANCREYYSPGTPRSPTEIIGTPTQTSRSSPTSSSSHATPASTAAPRTDLLSCPIPDGSQENPSQPLQLLYTKNDQLWLWDEISQEQTLVDLPPDAVAPHISPDGRYAAYLVAGQSYENPENPLAEIPLWLFDLHSRQAWQVRSFPVSAARRQNPDSPHIYLQMNWVESEVNTQVDHLLLVEIFSEPWAETGCCPPRGDLYLVKAETGETWRILQGEAYNFYSLHPDGTQIAALNLNGEVYLVNLPPKDREEFLSIPLPDNPWLVFAPVYSPDGAYMALQVDQGLAVIDSQDGSMQFLTLENPCQDCYWGPRLPIVWHADSKRFFTSTSLNDYFDRRAETSLIQVRLGSTLETELMVVIRANPFTLDFAPDFAYLSYWSQPDWDSVDASEEKMNWVSLYLMDLESLEIVLYQEQFGLRLSSWNPDSQRFLYTYSSVGGPNLDRKRFSLGSVCQQSQQMPVPAGVIISEVLWLDDGRFLAWTLPEEGIPDRYASGLYLYGLGMEGLPLLIDEIPVHQTEPYGAIRQVVVLEP